MFRIFHAWSKNNYIYLKKWTNHNISIALLGISLGPHSLQNSTRLDFLWIPLDHLLVRPILPITRSPLKINQVRLFQSGNKMDFQWKKFPFIINHLKTWRLSLLHIKRSHKMCMKIWVKQITSLRNKYWKQTTSSILLVSMKMGNQRMRIKENKAKCWSKLENKIKDMKIVITTI